MSAPIFNGSIQPRRSVETAAASLKRLYQVERETMRALSAWHISIATSELKLLTPRHAWQDSLHANVLRERGLELRYPRRDVDRGHDLPLTSFLLELTRAHDEVEFVSGIYDVLKPALLAAYRAYLAAGDDVDDGPSLYHIAHIIADEEAQIAEAHAILATTPARRDATRPWIDYLMAYLHAIGGILGDDERSALPSEHPCFGRRNYAVPREAARDPRFLPATVSMPRRHPQTPREEQIWSGINHANEIWATELLGTLIWRWSEMPWSFYTECAHWAYDELRHSQMGLRRMQAWGFRPGIDFPMVSAPYHAMSQRDPLEQLALLHSVERDGPVVKQERKARYEQLGDEASAQDCDYDWADEALHVRYGNTWLRHRLGPAGHKRLHGLVKEARDRWDAWVARRYEMDEDGFDRYMRRLTAHLDEEAGGTS